MSSDDGGRRAIRPVRPRRARAAGLTTVRQPLVDNAPKAAQLLLELVYAELERRVLSAENQAPTGDAMKASKRGRLGLRLSQSKDRQRRRPQLPDRPWKSQPYDHTMWWATTGST